MKTKELIYRILQLLKVNTDDSSENYSEEFIYNVLLEKRAFIIKQQYKDARKNIPLSMYQEICVDLEKTNIIPGLECTDEILTSTNPLPKLIDFSADYGVSRLILHTVDKYNIPFSVVPFERLAYVGSSKWTKNLVFVALGYDYKLYFKSNNPLILKLNMVKVYGIFNNPEEAANYSCTDTIICDVLDSDFPLDESLIDYVIRLTINELLPTIDLKNDLQNDSSEPRNN